MKTSETIKAIAPAIASFHSEVGKIAKKSENTFFKNKYAALPYILSAIAEPLKNAGLIILQMPKMTDKGNSLETVLMHTSGEWISEEYLMQPVKSDPQSMGSAITYARRYAIGAILNLNIDVDDDGNKASEPEKKAPEKKAPVQKPKLTTNLHEAWNKCVTALKNKYTMDDLLKKWDISEANQQLLKQEAGL